MRSIAEIIEQRAGSADELAAAVGELAATTVPFMYGRWAGFEIQTGHAMNGLLEPSGWYGKVFRSEDEVHPLVFFTDKKRALYAVDPKKVPLRAKVPKNRALGVMMSLAKPAMATRRSKARLRVIDYEGRSTATMIYDHKPILDHFFRVDEQTVLGVMDLKREPMPYYFVLTRDDESQFDLRF